ncbi:WxL domain-containing protein [uncultured Enterococcus sp.]|uniref:WxL domain-containing protein n=1 Tax=uncultured Enterococcus sp. TaxID=167972 RepID=UPI002AA6C12D|nr:WxL domain-containing protein [uncultured Enterococcus sp.]
MIDEISGHIFTNDQLTKVSVEGDIVEGDLAEAGAVINVLYSAKTTLTINFINEVGAELHAPIVQEHNIGDFVDLQIDQDVRDAIAAIEASQYVLDEWPNDEDNIEIVVNGTEVTYKFIGTLSIHSAPDVINFGDQKVGMFGTKVREPEYDNPFVIWDNRAGLGSWTLTAKLETPLTNLDDNTKVLVDAIRYQVTDDEASEITLNDQSQDIAIRNHPTAGEYVLSDEWSADGKGFKLEVPAGAVRKLGKYQATILWKLGATP